MPDVAPGCSPVWLINEDASDYEARPFRDSHTNFECVRIRSSNVAPNQTPDRIPQMIKEMNMVAINREAAAVYLLDDDASILKATRRLLDSAGWNNVKIFTDPIAFLEHAAMHRPKLAVIDISDAGYERAGGANAAATGFALDTRDRVDWPGRSVNPSNRDKRRRFCFLHQRSGERRFSRRGGGCGRFRQLVSTADLTIPILAQAAIQRYHVSAAKQQKVSSASDAPDETLPPKPYD